MKREQVLVMLRNNRDVMRRFSVKSLYLFGSVARGESKEGSDVDILIVWETIQDDLASIVPNLKNLLRKQGA